MNSPAVIFRFKSKVFDHLKAAHVLSTYCAAYKFGDPKFSRFCGYRRPNYDIIRHDKTGCTLEQGQEMTEENKPTAQRSIFAQWREGKVWHRHFLWLTLRRMAFVLASAVAVCGFVAEASIPMTVKCRCERADADRDIVGENLSVFVLGHSSSMGISHSNHSNGKNGSCFVRYGRGGDCGCRFSGFGQVLDSVFVRKR